MTSSESEESWDEMAARVANEVTDIVNLTYAHGLARSLQAYVHVGFSHDQAFQLVKVEHRARMDLLTSRVIMNGGEDPEGA